MKITEPTTMVTDYLVAGLSLYCWAQLRSNAQQRHVVAERWWSRAFLATAVGAIAGGTTHGFSHYLGAIGWQLLWRLTVYALAVASCCLLVAAFIAAFRGRPLKVLLSLAWIKLVLYLIVISRVEDLGFEDFDYVIYEYGSSMTVVLLLQIWSWLRHRSPAAPWIIAGIVVSTIASQIQMNRLGLHHHFNHNDLFHVVQMAGLWLLYRGGLQLEDAS